MAKKKYLPLYHKYLKAGIIPELETQHSIGGLCSLFPNDKLLELCSPPKDGSCWYWGYSEQDEDCQFIYRNGFEFTPLRQNILLLMCCLNGEL